jgi:streptogramin lyase
LRELSFLFGPGSVGYCAPEGECKIAYPKGSIPIGIVKGHDGLYYVSQASAARIKVFALQEDRTLLQIDEILAEMGVDNLSVDSNGDIFG